MSSQFLSRQISTGKMPRRWEVVSMGDVVEIYDSKRIPLSEMERNQRKGVYPYCGANGIIDYINGYIFDGEYLLLAEDGGDYGKYGRSAYLITGKFWVNNHAHILNARKNITNNLFLSYALNYYDLNPYIVGSTRKKLNQEQMKEIKIPLPPLPEQKKIAEILKAVDQGIEKVEEAIGKTQRLKNGLMQELLTKGIGHKDFKETEIGRIPREWNMMKLGEIANVRYGLGQPPAIEANGIPMIRATNVKRGRIAREGLIFINPNAVPNSRDPFLRAGDILVVRSGAYTGDVALVTKEWEGAVAGYDLIVTPSDTIDSQFLTYYLLSSSVQKRHFVGLKVRSAQPHLNSSQVEETPIPLPPLSEQQKIAEILSTVDNRLELLRKRKERLNMIRKGLMNDLLTGKVRVKNLKVGDSSSSRFTGTPQNDKKDAP